jgi:GNAT superfamily N-acetyltransferase
VNNDIVHGQHHIHLRPGLLEDYVFQLNLYADTRSVEMSLVDWPEENKQAFLQMQFDAQTSHYQIHFSNAVTQIIQLDGVDIGRLILNRAEETILLVDIALLAPYHNQKIGTAILQDLLKEAGRAGQTVTLRVEVFNPAMKLYERLDFGKTRLMGVYQEMIWCPNPVNGATALPAMDGSYA